MEPPHSPGEFGALHSPLLLPARSEPCRVEMGSREMRAPKGEESPSTSIRFWFLTHSNVTQEELPNLNRSKSRTRYFCRE